MSDLEIRSGAVIAVDTAELHHAARELMAVAAECEVVHKRLLEVYDIVAAEGAWANLPFWIAADVIERTRAIADDLRTLATVYEVVELRVQREAAEAVGDELLVRSLTGRLAVLTDSLPWWEQVKASVPDWLWRASSHAELTRQTLQAGIPFGPWGVGAASAVAAVLALVRGVDRGPVPEGARLRGLEQPVRLNRLRTPSQVSAPASVADVIGRVPGDEHGRIRVERYTMPDGSQQFAAYIAGTRIEGGPAEPFDMMSNLELYFGVQSASYEAVAEALRDAGARPGDVVHLAGHSQGAMVASRLALEGEFDVSTIITAGSPVQADVGDETLQVALRHSDDPVSALAAGGFAGASGSPDSFVAERVADPVGTVFDGLGAHHIDEYAETAEMLDASSDPRMDTVRERLDELSAATSVTATVYGVEELERNAAARDWAILTAVAVTPDV